MLTPPQHSKPPGTICHRVCFSKVFCMVKQRWSVMEALNPSVMSQTPPLLTLQVRWTHHAPGPSIQHNNKFKLLLNFYYFICLWIKCKEISVTLSQNVLFLSCQDLTCYRICRARRGVVSLCLLAQTTASSSRQEASSAASIRSTPFTWTHDVSPEPETKSESSQRSNAA